jgi:hypothetical protein
MNKLAVVDQTRTGAAIARRPEPLKLDEIRELAEVFVASKMFPDVESLAQAMVKIKAGDELGFSPFVSMGGVHIIKGKASLGATLQASVIRDSGRYRYDVFELTDTRCVLVFSERINAMQWQKLGESVFTIEDAKAAKLYDSGGDMYKKYARNMLFSRALTNGMRWYCPDLLRAADGDAVSYVDFDVDQVVGDTAATAEGEAQIQEHVDGEVVEDTITKTPEELRAEKVEHVQNLGKWLNSAKDSIEWKASTLANYINHMFDVDDGIRSLDFESLDKLIADLTERLEALTGQTDGK